MTIPDHPPTGGARKREPIFNIPAVVIVLVGALLAIHAGIELLSPASADSIIVEFGFIPGRMTLAFWPGQLAGLMPRARANLDPQALQQAEIARDFVFSQGGAKLWTLLTYAGRDWRGPWPSARRAGPARMPMSCGRG